MLPSSRNKKLKSSVMKMLYAKLSTSHDDLLAKYNDLLKKHDEQVESSKTLKASNYKLKLEHHDLEYKHQELEYAYDAIERSLNEFAKVNVVKLNASTSCDDLHDIPCSLFMQYHTIL